MHQSRQDDGERILRYLAESPSVHWLQRSGMKSWNGQSSFQIKLCQSLELQYPKAPCSDGKKKHKDVHKKRGGRNGWDSIKEGVAHYAKVLQTTENSLVLHVPSGHSPGGVGSQCLETNPPMAHGYSLVVVFPNAVYEFLLMLIWPCVTTLCAN